MSQVRNIFNLLPFSFNSLQSQGEFSGRGLFMDECNNNAVAMTTEPCVVDEVMEEDAGEMSWNPAVLSRINSPGLSRESFQSHEERVFDDFRFVSNIRNGISDERMC